MNNVLTVSSENFGTIGTLTPRAESYSWKPSAKAVKTGRVVSPSHIQDFKRAAIYLATEHAAISLRCNGYLVAK